MARFVSAHVTLAQNSRRHMRVFIMFKDPRKREILSRKIYKLLISVGLAPLPQAREVQGYFETGSTIYKSPQK